MIKYSKKIVISYIILALIIMVLFYFQFCSPSADNTVRFEQSGASLDIESPLASLFIKQGNELSIQYGDEYYIVDKDIKEYDLKRNSSAIITIPKNLNEVEIETVTANIILNEFNSSDLKLDTISGSIDTSIIANINEVDLETISGVISVSSLENINDVNISSISGEVELHNANAINNIEVETTSSNIYLNASDIRQINIESTSGNIDLITDEKYKLNFETLSGELINNNEDTDINSNLYIQAETVSGNLKINR